VKRVRRAWLRLLADVRRGVGGEGGGVAIAGGEREGVVRIKSHFDGI
jgi:hypothetical protein